MKRENPRFFGQLLQRMTLSAPLAGFLVDDVLAQIDARVADVYTGAGNELEDPILRQSAKGAAEISCCLFAVADDSCSCEGRYSSSCASAMARRHMARGIITASARLRAPRPRRERPTFVTVERKRVISANLRSIFNSRANLRTILVSICAVGISLVSLEIRS
jgi:hypothetical protein